MAITYPAGPIQAIEEAFILADRSALLAYLTNQTEVVPYLVNLVQQARVIYGEDTRVSLRRDSDPDADSDYLVVGIRSSLAPAEAQHLLYRLRDEWWSTTPSDIADQILVANEYV